MKKIIIRVLGAVLLVAMGWGAYRFLQGLPSRQVQTPVTKVRQGDVVVRTFTRGELRAVRTATLSAPNLFGTIQVTRLAPIGSFAREKDLIIEFDDSEVQARLDQKQLELEQLDEQIKKSQADLSIRNNQDQVDLLRSRYSVRRAELEVKRNELLSTIDQKKNVLNLEEARRRLQQLESDIKSKQEQAQAELAVLREKRNRALLDITRERMRLGQVKMLAPISGLVAIRQNRSGFMGMFGSSVPDIREGDQLQPGIPVGDVLDLSELEIIARVGELDRANLKDGQDVQIRLDAVSDKTFHGKIKAMSGTASANIFSSDPGKKFDVTFSIDMHELLTGLGAKPDQIARIMRTAEENRKKPIAQAPSFAAMFSGMTGGGAQGGVMPGGGMPGGGMPGGMDASAAPGGGGPMVVMMGAPSGGAPGADGARSGRGGQGGPGGGAGMTDEMRQKMRDAMQKELKGRNMQDLSAEERQALFAKIRETVQGGGAATAKKGESAKSDGKSADAKKGEGPAPGGPMMVTFGGPGGPGAPGGGRGGNGMPAMMGGLGGGNFTQKDLDNAQIPAAPGDDSNLEILLRPGLLADVEITVEKVANAVYVPNQSVFEKDSKPVVYVRGADGRFEAHVIKIAKRSETVTIVAEGIKAGDTIAVQDPTIKPGDRKSDKKDTKGGAAGALPPAGAAGGGR